MLRSAVPITSIVGEQRGDEGKGRFVDLLAQEHDIVARFNGGDNAGHTVVLPDGRELKTHTIPSGIAHPHVVNVVGSGVYLNALNLPDEIASFEASDIEITPDNLKISSAAHLILPHHVFLDKIREAGAGAQGSTKSGIAQVAADKYKRVGVRAEMINEDPDKLYEIVLAGLQSQIELRRTAELDEVDELAVAKEYIQKAKQVGVFVTDTVVYLNRELHRDKRVLAEGAQGFLLDIDHGMYPYTTSSSPISGGLPTGLGVPAKFIERVIGVSKATQSHVGGGPFVTEIHDEQLLARLHGDLEAIDSETGTTTGRVRRLGHLDLPIVRRAQMVNGTDEMALAKLDWVPRYGDEVPVCVAYSRDGQTFEVAPDSAFQLDQCTPRYEYLPTWAEDIQAIQKFEDLPSNAQNYITFIENQTGVPVTMIGVGPRRDQVIVR